MSGKARQGRDRPALGDRTSVGGRRNAMGVFKKQGVYWIDYYVQGHRKRERIGPDKRLAETVFKKRKVEIAEGRFLEKKRPVTTTFDELAHAYLPYSRKNKRSWDRDTRSVKHLAVVFSEKRLTEIAPADIERYKTLRQTNTDSHGRHPQPATINRELACLKAMFNVARKGLLHLPGGLPTENPVSCVEFFDEHNIRDRILTAEEFHRMLDASPDYLRPILQCAYYTGMRRGEVLALTWDKVDFKAGFIRLKDADTKTDEARSIPIGRELREVLGHLPVVLDAQGKRVLYVFTHNGQRVKSIKRVFARVRQQTGITNTVFHDFRHTATTNLRRAGVDALTAMKITGHKTMAVFKRYNTIDEQDLKVAQRQRDTYMDINREIIRPDYLQTHEN
jgi:integrase